MFRNERVFECIYDSLINSYLLFKLHLPQLYAQLNVQLPCHAPPIVKPFRPESFNTLEV